MRHLPLLLIVLAALGAILVLGGDLLAPAGDEAAGPAAGDEDGAGLLAAEGPAIGEGGEEGVRLLGSGRPGATDEGGGGRSRAAGAGGASADAGGGDGAAAVGASALLAVEGTVLGPDGRPVAGAAVQLTSGGILHMALADEDGRYVLEVYPGRYRLQVRADGVGGLVRDGLLFEGTATQALDLELEPLVELAVRVTREGVGVPGAVVGLGSAHRAESEGDGTARFEAVLPGPAALHVEAPGEPILQRDVRLRGPTMTLDVPLPEAVPFRGTVQGPDGEPVPGATVRLRVRTGGGFATEAGATTDATGRFETTAPRGRPLDLEVRAAGYAVWPRPRDRSARRAVAPLMGGQPIVLAVTLQGGIVVEGRVTAEGGEPLPGVLLRFRRRGQLDVDVVADEAGTYRFDQAWPGRYEVRVPDPAWAPRRPLRPQVPRLEAGSVHVFDVELVGTRTIAGRVLAPGGEPAPGARVWAEVPMAGTRETFADAGGRWTLASVARTRGATLRASLGDLEARPRYVPVDAPRADDLVLRLGGTVRLEGQVFDTEGRAPVAGARVEAIPRGPPGGRPRQRTETDAEGRFVLGEMIPGRWLLVPSRSDFLRAEGREVALEADAEVVREVLHLDPGLAVGGLVTTPEGQAVAGARVDVWGHSDEGRFLRRTGRTDEQGRWRLTGFTPGTYELMARASGWRAGRLHEVRGGQERLLVALRPPPPDNTAR